MAVVVLVITLAAGSTDAACGRCHASQASTTAHSAHQGVACYSCHLDKSGWLTVAAKADELLRMYPRQLLSGKLTSLPRQTSRDSCLACHENVLQGVTAAGNLRIKHALCAQGPTCDGCHSAVAHDKAVRWQGQPVMEKCVACHQERGRSVKCETCHKESPGSRQRTAGPWQVTHGPQWEQTHGMGQLSSCATCHPKDFCVKCHGLPVPHAPDFGRSHGSYALRDRASCTTCHKSEAFCTACHGATDMPHPAGFLKGHSKIAKGTSDPACIRCHVPTDCSQCHKNHIHPGYAAEAAATLNKKAP
jgi:hypothetical protein